MQQSDRGAERGEEPGANRRLAVLGALALAIMAPVTMPVPVLRELVQDRFAVSEFLTSLFMSVNMVGGFIAAPIAGAVADRIGRSRWLLVGAIAADALCFWILTLPIAFPVFMAVRFAEGCAHITALSVLLSLASQTLSPEHRGRAMGLVGGCMMLGIACGAPVGGVLGRSSALLPLSVGAVMLLVAALLAALTVREGGAAGERPRFSAIVAALRAHPAVVAPLAFAFTDRFTVGFFTTTFALYLRRIHDVSSAEIGILIASFMIPFAVFSYPFGRLAERGSLVLLLCGGSLVYGLGTAAVGFAGPRALYALMFGIGICAAVMFVPSLLMTIRIAPESIRATALGAFNAAGSLGFILGPAVGGAVSQWVAGQHGWLAGYRAAFVTAGLSEAVCVAVALPVLWRVGRRAVSGAPTP